MQDIQNSFSVQQLQVCKRKREVLCMTQLSQLAPYIVAQAEGNLLHSLEEEVEVGRNSACSWELEDEGVEETSDEKEGLVSAEKHALHAVQDGIKQHSRASHLEAQQQPTAQSLAWPETKDKQKKITMQSSKEAMVLNMQALFKVKPKKQIKEGF
jgi:hypothetical protein